MSRHNLIQRGAQLIIRVKIENQKIPFSGVQDHQGNTKM